jgi:hypothetical protein
MEPSPKDTAHVARMSGDFAESLMVPPESTSKAIGSAFVIHTCNCSVSRPWRIGNSGNDTLARTL